MWERIRQAGRKGGDGARCDSGFAGRRLSYACIAFSTHLSTLRARSRASSVLRGYTLCCRVSGTRFTYAPIGPRYVIASYLTSFTFPSSTKYISSFHLSIWPENIHMRLAT
ncbi:uncharacterized protein LAESUDRAFT_496321 [Laetiporus sulphureus 93-53]|uniref:Uncharacterized protein n=1 Tax=Laetiporus sulphureus 93-53 TaxID=1314785 RepID=A0A165BGP8_9APHY|nr:uncharacterized protein LAESUDRAFT_496321 [Laetiporus sulphureus 93-53]KZT01022.1 hypothetical protein LAESUDRAFT_496321 [Laetiporus sulphureus 93-53]